jgi:PAS domain S-box-containing protein
MNSKPNLEARRRVDITSFFWYVLSIFILGMSVWLFHLFFKEKDLRKLMFSFGLLPSVFTFVYLGVTFPPPIQAEQTMFFSLFKWGTIPIIESIFFILGDRIFYGKRDFKVPFAMFLFFYLFSFFLLLSNTIPEIIFYSSIQFGTIVILVLSIVLIIKEKMFSGWLFFLSVCCFAIAGISLSYYMRQDENITNSLLTMFSFFLAYTFFVLIFKLPATIKQKDGIGAYFSLEEKIKKIEAELYDSERKYRQVVESLKEGILVFDNKSCTTYVNSYAAQMLEYTTNEMTGKSFFEFLDDSGKNFVQEKLEYIIDNVENDYEIEFLRKNKTKILTSVHMSTLFDKDGNKIGILLVIQDISYKKQMESELEEKLKKLQKSELATLNIMEDLQNSIGALTLAETEICDKNETLKKINTELTSAREELTILNKDLEKKVKERTADVEKLLKQKDEFVGQLGHDLKTPLTPLNILVPIVRDQEQDPKLKELLNVISNNIQYMKNLVIKTLSLAELNSDNYKFGFEDINLSEQVRNFLNMESMFFEGKNVCIQNNIPQDIIVQVDLVQIKELFDNLISNAVKYSKPDGVKITLDAQKKDDLIMISINDTGIGLESNQIEHVFDEFYKVDYSRHDLQSTGLGLSISKRIVEKHGGRIWVESQGKGKGSTFFFTLKAPLKKED